MRTLLALIIITLSIPAAAFNGSPISNSIDKVVVVTWQNPTATKPGPDAGGLGTGFVVDRESGYIVTNHHVIAGAIRLDLPVMISFYRGVNLDDINMPVEAVIVGYDASIDLAVLKVPSSTIKDRRIQNAIFDTSYELGDEVWIIGHPTGLYYSVSKGILSHLHRRGYDSKKKVVNFWQRLLQTDAALNGGNSGGPVFDRLGRVTGVAVSIISPNGGSVGLGMMIEGLLAKKAIADIIEYGKYRVPFFGISFDTTAFEAKDYRVVVKDVIEGSSVEGLFLPGDTVIKFDKYRIHSVQNLFFYISYLHVGDTIDFTVIRDGEELVIRNVKIKAKPAIN